jgi:hypothetical protein
LRTAAVGTRRLRPAVHQVEEADEASALYDETPRPVDVAMDAVRSRRAGKGARGVRGPRLPPIAFAAEAVFRKGEVQPVEEGGIDRALQKVSEVTRAQKAETP